MNKYQILKVIDQGAYGYVLLAKNKVDGSQGNVKLLVAIKKFKETQEDPLAKKIIRREIKMLNALKSQFVVELIQAFRKYITLIRKGKVYLVFELCKKNILNLIQQFPKGIDVKLTYQPQIIQFLIFQLIRCLEFIHSRNVMHRDIKPENLLLTQTYKMKLCDFGFARYMPNENATLTDYVATRWYRSPELLVGQRYDFASDIWNIGCILCQMTDGQPLFPGQNDIDQIYIIQRNLGALPQQLIQVYKQNPVYNGIEFPYTHKVQSIQARFIGKLSKNALSFTKQCLRLDPKKRPSAKQLLHHPYLQGLMSQFTKNHQEQQLFKKEVQIQFLKRGSNKITNIPVIKKSIPLVDIQDSKKKMKVKKNCGIIYSNFDTKLNFSQKNIGHKRQNKFAVQIRNSQQRGKPVLQTKKKSIDLVNLFQLLIVLKAFFRKLRNHLQWLFPKKSRKKRIPMKK